MQDQQLYFTYFTSSYVCFDMLCNCLPTAAKPGDPVKIDKVIITPDPPQKGKNVTIQATATLCMVLQFYNYI